MCLPVLEVNSQDLEYDMSSYLYIFSIHLTVCVYFDVDQTSCVVLIYSRPTCIISKSALMLNRVCDTNGLNSILIRIISITMHVAF